MLLIAGAIFVVWLVSSAVRLYTNYRNARLTGFPIVVCPVNPQNLLYVLVNAPLRPWLMRHVPPALYNRFKVCTFGWQCVDRHAFHDAVGPVFVLVTTGVNQLWIADPAVAQVVLTRRKDFRTVHVTKMVMSLAGTNMITSDDETWARQRRLIAPNLNERVSALVWAESMQQASQMADYLGADGSTSDTTDDTKAGHTVSSLRSVAINVLGQVGYGQPKPFRPLELPRDPRASIEYIDAVSLATELIVVASFVPHKLLTLPVMPRLLQTLGVAMRRLPQLAADMLEQQRQRDADEAKEEAKEEADAKKGQKTEKRESIMGLMVRLSDKQKAEEKRGNSESGGSSGGGFLLEDEIHGNLFLVTGAGFDTTANTMSYAVALLAVHADKQQWIQDEVDRVFGDVPPDGLAAMAGRYDALYPKLVRCLAFVHEVLRLYPPIMHISRETNRDQTITAHGTTHLLVGRYEVHVNSAGLQTRPALWGADADEFRPERWIAVNKETGQEEIVPARRGTFSPWSSGPRVCPGQKMSQVEIVVVFATLLWRCRVSPVVKDGETLQDARDRILAVAADSQPRLTLQMNRPEDLLLRWEKRR